MNPGSALRAIGLALSIAACREIVAISPPDPVAAWGDSLTAADYPFDLASALGRPVFNGGVGGETSSQILGRIKADTAHRNDLVIIWAGNNNFYEPEQVEADIAEAIQTIAPRHFFVLTIVVGDFPDRYPGTSNYAAIKRLNGDLLEKYPNNVIDISSYLNALYDPTVPEDVVDHERDVLPSSLRVDQVHLTAHGYQLVAGKVAAEILARGW